MNIEYFLKIFAFSILLYYTMEYIFSSKIDNMSGFSILFIAILITCIVFFELHKDKFN